MNEVLIIFFCLVLNALFAAYEMAFIAVPKSELQSFAKSGSHHAKRLLEFKKNPERTLSVIQIGITLVSAIAAAVGGAGAEESIAPLLARQFDLTLSAAGIFAVALVVIPITYFSVVVGELVPKALALRNALKIAMKGAGALLVADRVFSPIVSILEESTKLILRIFFKKTKSMPSTDQVTIEVDSMSPMHRAYMFNMAGMRKRRVKDILLPWSQVAFIQTKDSIEEITRQIFDSGYTRLPVVEDDQLIGILHTKEFMALKESGETHWQKIIRPAIYAYPMDSLLGILRMMQEKRSHMAVVFSEEEERLGIITMEDILEEIVGEISDEDDDGTVRRIFASRKFKQNPLHEKNH